MKKIQTRLFLSSLFSFLCFLSWAQPSISGPMFPCPGAEATYSVATFCDSAYVWSLDSPLGSIQGANDGQSVTIDWESEGSAVILLTVIESTSDTCSGGGQYTVPISIEIVPIQTELSFTACNGTCVEYNGDQLCDSGTYTYVFTSWLGCDSTVLVDVAVNPGPIVIDMGTICAGSAFICGQEFTLPGSYETTCYCDTTVQFTIAPAPSITLQPASMPCDGSDLTLQASVTPANAALQWTAANGGEIISAAQSLQPVVGSPGVYCLLANDPDSGCTSESCMFVSPAILLDVGFDTLPCAGPNEIVYQIGGSVNTPFTFFLSENGEAPSSFQTSELAGSFETDITEDTQFQFWVVDNEGCVSDTTELAVDVFSGDIEFTVEQEGCDPATVTAIFNNLIDTVIVYDWSNNGGFGPSIEVSSSGWYAVTITDLFTNCNIVDSVFVDLDYSGTCAIIEGQVNEDLNDDCLPGNDDPALEGWLVVASGNNVYYGTTDAAGHYSIPVEPGSYTVSIETPNPFWEACENSLPVALPTADETANVDFLLDRLPGCPIMTVEISTPNLRRCSSNNFYYVHYCNDGVEAAEDAYVVVNFDPFIQIISSPLAYQDLGNNAYRFDLGTVGAGECGDFQVQVMVGCNAFLGQTHCTDAHIYPDTTCLPPDPQWLGASLDMQVECLDSVYFTIENVGTAPMSQPLEYLVIEDAVMLMTVPDGPILNPGESVRLAYPANGSTWRVEVQQEAFHPAAVAPVLVVEGCNAGGGEVSAGFVNQFSLGDEVGFVDIDCTENSGSYDPNDKQGIPVGYGTEHYLKPGTPVDYLIRFQNTGTDTAFNVVVKDTLSRFLDVASVRPGASSHFYKFETYGEGILKFTFPDIMLPDSNVNVEGSQGFVKFKVWPKSNVPLGSLLENSAAIFFDFNEPVITNTVSHVIDENFITVTGIHTAIENVEMKAYPNPFDESVKFEIDGYPVGKPLIFRLIDQLGREVEQKDFQAPGFDFVNNELPSGLYFFEIKDGGDLVAAGKLLRR